MYNYIIYTCLIVLSHPQLEEKLYIYIRIINHWASQIATEASCSLTMDGHTGAVWTVARL